VGFLPQPPRASILATTRGRMYFDAPAAELRYHDFWDGNDAPGISCTRNAIEQHGMNVDPTDLGETAAGYRTNNSLVRAR
jgi:hypothetical protein